MVTRVYVPTSTEGDVENNTFESLNLAIYRSLYIRKSKTKEARSTALP